MDIFSKRLKEERQVKHYTQKQMAELLGISLRAYENYEALGMNHREPDLELICKIADVLDVSVDYLLGRKEF